MEEELKGMEKKLKGQYHRHQETRHQNYRPTIVPLTSKRSETPALPPAPQLTLRLAARACKNTNWSARTSLQFLSIHS